MFMVQWACMAENTHAHTHTNHIAFQYQATYDQEEKVVHDDGRTR